MTVIIYEYPNGVLTGEPFESFAEGIRWIHDAAVAGYPHIEFTWKDPKWLTPPLVTSEPLLDLETDYTDITLVRDAWTLKDDDPNAPYPLDLPVLREMPTRNQLNRDDWALEFATEHFLYLTGVGDCMRREIPVSKTRAQIAKRLGRVELALERVHEQVVIRLNAYVTSLWREAILSGEQTNPPNPYGPKTETKTKNMGVGHLKLN